MKKTILAVLSFFLCMYATAQTADKDFAAADSLIDKELYKEAIALLSNMIQSYGVKEDYLTRRAYAYLQVKDHAKAKADYDKVLVSNPQCTKCLINMGMTEVDNRNFASAISYLDRFIKLKPAESVGYVKRGEAEFETGKYDEAIADFNKGLQLDPTMSAYIYLYLSMTKLAKGNYSEALSDINQSLNIQPNSEFAYYVRGKIYINMGDYNAAIKDLFSCLQKRPDFSEYHTYAGIALYYLNDYNKAMQAFNESIKLDSNDHLPFQYRSYLLYSDAGFTKACIDKQKALVIATAAGNNAATKQIQQEINEYCDLSKPGAHYHSGQVLFGQSSFDKAQLAYNNGLRRFPDDPLLLEGIGNTAIAMGQFNDALGYYNKCLQHFDKINTRYLISADDPKSIQDHLDLFRSQLFNSIAFAHVNLLHFDSATIWMGKAIEVLQKNPAVKDRDNILSQFLVKRSVVFRLQNEDAAADADIATALQVYPRNAEAYLERARHLIYKNTVGKEINPNNLGILNQPNRPTVVGYITIPSKNWDQKEVEAALEDCTKAIAYDSGNREAYMIRAQAKILLKKGDHCSDILQAKKLGVTDAASQLNVTCN